MCQSRGALKISVSFSQFYYDPKNSLKNIIFKKLKKNNNIISEREIKTVPFTVISKRIKYLE